MKVVCGACQAKYQIPDERVAGRKLKIRCRKCGDAIVVRGDQIALEQPEEPTQTNGHHGAVGATEWHLSIEGDQHGPYSTEQMASMLREGQVAWDTYAWREGYADWKTAAESDTLVRAVASMPSVEIAAPTPEPIAAPEVDDGPTRMVGSVPPGSLAPVARASFSQRAHRAQSAPPGEVAPAAASVAVAAGYPVQRELHSNGFGARPYVSVEQAMTGERHEDSVLFSTKNLQATVSPSQASPARNGFATAEGSGLIDIRALAALARSGQHSAPALPTTAIETAPVTPHGRDEVMALASQTGAFSNLDSLRPFEAAPRQSSNAVPIAIVMGSALIAAAAVFAVYLTRDPAPAQPPAAAAAIVAEPAAALAEPAAEPAEAAPAEEPQPEAQAAAEKPAEAEEAAAPSAPTEKRSRGASSSKRAGHGSAKSEPRTVKAQAVAAAEKSKPEPEPKAEKEAKADKGEKADKGDDKKESASIDDLLLADAKPAEKAEKPAISVDDVIAAPKPASSKSRSIDELLDTAVIEGNKKGKAAAEPSAESAALPDTPSRDQVKGAMKAIAGDVKACAAGQTVESPTATASVSVSGATGKVSSVRVTGIQGAVGSCIAKVVRGASFPKFAKEAFTFDFPFKLQ